MDLARLVERRLDDGPGPLDDVLTGEPAGRAVDGVVEQPLVGLVALAEGGGEVDADVDLLAVEVRPRRLGLQGEGDAVGLAQPEADQVAPGGGPPASSNSNCGGSRSSTTASVTEWASALPTRTYHGTPAQRHESMHSRVAT